MPVAASEIWSTLAWAALFAAAASDAWRGRVPNAIVVAALVAVAFAHPTPSTLLGGVLGAAPLFALALPRLVGMGDMKFAVAVGAVLGLSLVPWWWAWAALGAAVTLTVGTVVVPRRVRLPLAPALLAAAVATATGVAR